MRKFSRLLVGGLIVTWLAASPAGAADGISKGSLGEGGHTHYIPSVSNPYLNETPFITSEARPIFLYNTIPGNVFADTPFAPGVPGGGQITIVTLQMRLALTDRLGIIFNKNGLMNYNHSTSSNVVSDNGLANLSFGVKYALVSEPREEKIVTVGLTYEMPTGTLKADVFRLQGDGRGYLNGFVTAAESFNKVGVQGMMGIKLSLDGERSVSWFNFALHMDYEILPDFFPLVEFNGFVPLIEDARQYALEFEGLDLFSAGGSDPHTVITMAVGSRYRIMKNILAGLAYEIPVTDSQDIIQWRLTCDVVAHF